MSGNQNLCTRCSNIQWADLAIDKDNIIADSLTNPSSSGVHVAPLEESHQALTDSSCTLCRLWASIKPPSLDNPSSSLKCHLRAFPSTILDDATVGFWTSRRPGRARRACTLVGAVVDSPSRYSDVYKIRTRGLFAIHRTSAILSADYGFGARRISPDRIDFSVFKESMALCEKKHWQTCAPTGVAHPRGFRVIDCESKTIVPAPSACRYAALSYVWGDTQADDEDLLDGMPLKSVPRVIEDSIAATLALGLRFLWVDRHCIKQNSDHKMEQITRMDQIYANSQITLVAVAGEDANYGLPGVEQRQRTPQRHYTLNDISFTQISGHVAAEVLNSTWFTRAWTYQEGYLAKRRLIFTDQQAAFVCNEIHRAESEQNQVDKLNRRSLWPFLTMIPDAMVSVDDSRGTEYLQQALGELGVRKMRYDDGATSDALNACLGILGSFEDNKVPMYHVQGLPMRIKRNEVPGEGSYLRSDRNVQLAIELGWWHQYPAERRNLFPSWSWVGWKAAPYIGGTAVVVDNPSVRVEIEEPRNNLIPLVSAVQSYLSKHKTLRSWSAPRYLYITAPLTNITMRHFTPIDTGSSQKTEVYLDGVHHEPGARRYATVKRKSGLHCILPLSADVTLAAYVYMDDANPPTHGLKGLVFPIDDYERNRSAQQIILIVKLFKLCNENAAVKEDGSYYERVGIVRISHAKDYHFDRSPALYLDAEMNVLDEVRLSPLGCRRWLDEAEMTRVKLA